MSKKIAIVTGGNKGIGLAIVQGLCKAGYAGDIILTARNEKLGQEALQKVKSEGHNNVLFHRLDICDQNSAEELQQFLEKKYDGLDVLINNAGIAFKDMSKKVAVVTGANKGVGLAIVKGLCKAGFAGDIILTSRNEKLGQGALQQIKSEGFNNVLYHRLDVCDQSSAEELRKFLEKNYGGLDVLINNAGILFKDGHATEPFAEQAIVTMRTNFWGTLWVSKALLPLLRPNARVVNVSSVYSKNALAKCSPDLQAKFRDPDMSEEELCRLMGEFVVAAQKGDHEAKGWPNSAYGSSKIGVTVLSRIHARDLSKTRPGDGILVNACCPGWVRTDMTGPEATKSPEEGAETPVYLAMLPVGAKEPHGQILWDKVVHDW